MGRSESNDHKRHIRSKASVKYQERNNYSSTCVCAFVTVPNTDGKDDVFGMEQRTGLEVPVVKTVSVHSGVCCMCVS